MLSLENLVAIPLPALEGGFGFSPWDEAFTGQPSPPTPHEPEQVNHQARPPAPAQGQTGAASPGSSGSTGSGRDRAGTEERRIRRMISNRESARRSRMRKQRHMEDLRRHADRLRSDNRGLAGGLVAATSRCLLLCRDNDRLRSEAAALRRRLSDARRLLIFRQLQRLASEAAPPPPPPCGGAAGALLSFADPHAALPPPPPPVYCGGFMTETELIA